MVSFIFFIKNFFGTESVSSSQIWAKGLQNQPNGKNTLPYNIPNRLEDSRKSIDTLLDLNFILGSDANVSHLDSNASFFSPQPNLNYRDNRPVTGDMRDNIYIERQQIDSQRSNKNVQCEQIERGLVNDDILKKNFRKKKKSKNQRYVIYVEYTLTIGMIWITQILKMASGCTSLRNRTN